MAKSTVAFGVAFMLKDLATKAMAKIASGFDVLSAKQKDATEASLAFGDSLSKPKVSKIVTGAKQAGSAFLSMGKQMLTATGSTESFVGALGDVIGAIPVVGPVIQKTASAVFTLLDSVGKLADEQSRWTANMSGGMPAMRDMIAGISTMATDVGTTSTELMGIARSMGSVSLEGAGLAQQVERMTRAFSISEVEAASYTKGMNAAGYSIKETSALGDEIVDMAKKLGLPDLMQDVPEIMEMARKSALQMGTDLKGRVGPAALGVAKSASVLTKTLGLLPKHALEVAKKTLGSFQSLSVNIENVFTGIDDDFDAGTKRLMEMSVRAGGGLKKSLSAIQKAATGDMTEIAAQFEKVMSKGGMGAKRMRLGLQKEFGPEFTKIIAAMGPKGKEMYAKVYGPLEAGGEKLDTVGGYDKFVNEMVNGAGNIKKQLSSITEEFVKSIGGGLPETREKLMGFFTFMKKEANTLKEEMNTWITGKDASTAKFMESVRAKVEPMIKDLANAVKAALVEWGIAAKFDSLVEGMSKLGVIFEKVGAAIDASQYGTRKVLSAVIGSGDPDVLAEMDAESARKNAVADSIIKQKDPKIIAAMMKPEMDRARAREAYNAEVAQARQVSGLGMGPAIAALTDRAQKKLNVQLELINSRVDANGIYKQLDAAEASKLKATPAR
jgi:hypothetical protein